MRRIRPFILLRSLLPTLFVIFALAMETGIVNAQQLKTTAQTERTLKRLETNTDRFSKSIDASLDRSRLNDSALEDQTNALVDELEFTTDRLKERAEDGIVIHSDVYEVLRRGTRLDMFMNTHNLSPVAQRDWKRVRGDLGLLARSYGVPWTWVPNTVNNSALNRASTQHVLRRLEQTADEFRESFDNSLDKSRLDGSSYEDFMNNVVATFERALDKLKGQANTSGPLDGEDLRTALNNAATIDEFLRRQSLSLRIRRDWARVKANLDDLAFLNKVAWDWSVRPGISPIANNLQQAQGERIGLTAMPTSSLTAIAREVRHELLSDLPYYSVFDWIEFEVLPDKTVVLTGEVTTPPDTKSRAEAVVKDVEGVNRVVNQIRVLSVSPNDDRLRRALYNAIYGFNSPLFRYGVGSRQAIHIIVDGGRATLKGVVDSQSDKQLAFSRARNVAGLFEVNNELVVDRGRLAM